MPRRGPAVYAARVKSAWLVLVTLGGCRENPDAPRQASTASSSGSPPSAVGASPAAHSGVAQLPLASGVASARPSPHGSAAPAASSAASASGLAIADLPIDVGPAGPAAATADGVVLATRTGGIQLARLGGLAADAKAAETRVAALDVDAANLVALGRAPAISGDHAYWVQGTELRRGRVSGGPAEVLATDARDGTRVSALQLGRSVAAYIAAVADRQVARLWVEGAPARDITPEGGNASSVALAPVLGGALALSLDPHLGMTPLHARPVSAADQTLGADVVAWVTGTAQPLTEVSAVGLGGKVLAFVAIERDSSQFGLARVEIAASPSTESGASWRSYANGLDPAPASAAVVCGHPLVAYARPVGATPHAPNEIVVAAADGAEPGSELVVAQARVTNDVTLAAVPRAAGGHGGALVTWVADRRTWAATLRCRH